MNALLASRVRTALVHAVLLTSAIIVIAPVAWTVAAGFRTQISFGSGANKIREQGG